jgi:MYXO-CTERM domain-containing protein
VYAIGALVSLVVLLGSVGGAAAATTDPRPTLAYYYIWFDATSWDRAKRDFPLLGRYSSDERRVMRQHVRWAKQAGIDGFIVSWKSSWRLNRRLEHLLDVAEEENFRLAVIYQGLDFERHPLPTARIAADLDQFADHYASREPFRLFAKPLVIWSGTWRFRASDIAAVSRRLRGRVLLLASEKDVAGYRRVARHVDGNAYYWSSVDPARWPTYWTKLVTMGRAVHDRGGLWIAPAAPGFDARLVGGSSVVDRRDGQTLRRRLDGAVRSNPDAIGIISWNEFSENTHIEPSERYGDRYLEITSDALGAGFRSKAELDSSDSPPRAATGIRYGTPLLIGLLTLAVVVGAAAIRRRRRPVALDGVSPELALVDPDLAGRLRSALPPSHDDDDGGNDSLASWTPTT